MGNNKWNDIEIVKRRRRVIIGIKWVFVKRKYFDVSLRFPSISILAKQQGYSIRANKKNSRWRCMYFFTIF